MHYGVGVVPARPYKPRDKAKAESGVLLAERWIIAALRHRKFLLNRGPERDHPRAARPHQSAAVSQTRRFKSIAVHGSG